jgi:glycerate kinase
MTCFKFPRGDVDVLVACDVENTLLGLQGCSAVYGPQKGATPEMVAILERALSRYAEVVNRQLGVDVGHMRCGGAAGGLAAGLHAFLGAELKPGVDIVLDAVDFDRHIRDADLVVTGEGRIDSQTLQGKTISGILRRSAVYRVPVVAIAGILGPGSEALYDVGVCHMRTIAAESVSEEESMQNAAELLSEASRGAMLSICNSSIH